MGIQKDIIDSCRQRKSKDVVCDQYAELIFQSQINKKEFNWKVINIAIIMRWSENTLASIKRAAWKQAATRLTHHQSLISAL